MENDLTNQTNNIDITTIRNKLNKIKKFTIYDEFVQSYIPNDCGILGLRLLSKQQNVNAWSSKCNYLINHIKNDFEKCLLLIEEDEDYFIGYRISEKDEDKFYYIENIEYRLFTLCDVLAQMYNELWDIEKNIGRINHSFFFSKKEIPIKISTQYKDENLKDFLIKEVNSIVEYFKENEDYKYIAEKRNSFTHRENPHDCMILNGGKKKVLVDHPLYELDKCMNVFIYTYLKICTVEKLFFFMLKDMGLLEEYEIIGIDKWDN